MVPSFVILPLLSFASSVLNITGTASTIRWAYFQKKNTLGNNFIQKMVGGLIFQGGSIFRDYSKLHKSAWYSYFVTGLRYAHSKVSLWVSVTSRVNVNKGS